MGPQPPQDQQQRQQQQQDQAEQPQAPQQALLASLSVTSMRVVACHSMGASFWLPVPTLKCSCCTEEWELQAAAAGFFGSSPVQPAVWFSSQLLDLYSTLFQSGLSATSWCEGISTATRTATEQNCTALPKTLQSLLPIDDRCVTEKGARLNWGPGLSNSINVCTHCPLCALTLHVPWMFQNLLPPRCAGTSDPHGSSGSMSANPGRVRRLWQHPWGSSIWVQLPAAPHVLPPLPLLKQRGLLVSQVCLYFCWWGLGS